MKLYDLKVDNSWDEFISSSRYFSDMLDFIDTEKDICPVKEKVFRFFECDIKNAKCIILGMDPYPSTYFDNGKEIPVATGRSFEVANVKLWTDKYKQVSLSNIFKALWYYKYNELISIRDIRKKIGNSDFKYINIHSWFDAMENQGVIFLNATLTTKRGCPDSHTKMWKDFINELLKYIGNKNKNVKWLIWGENAKNRISGIVNEKMIIYTCHPATRVNNTFVSDCCFKSVSDIKWA